MTQDTTHKPNCGSVVYAGRYPSQPCDCDDDREVDDRDNDAADDCDHIEAELSWEGRFECPCGHSWWATTEQQTAYWESVDRASRPPTLWERLSDWWLGAKSSIRQALRPRRQVELDDDIPF